MFMICDSHVGREAADFVAARLRGMLLALLAPALPDLRKPSGEGLLNGRSSSRKPGCRPKEG